MDANGFPLTIIVYVSSFSVDIKLPNHDRFVNSGEGSGVGVSDISSTSFEENKLRKLAANISRIFLLFS